MDDPPRWIGCHNKQTSTYIHESLTGIRGTSWPPYATSYRTSKVGGILADQNGGYGSTGSEVLLTNQQENIEAESIRTEPIYSDLERVPVQKKSRYHRYRKSTGMKAVGRSKAFWFLRRYQCQLLKEVWEDVEGSAMSHKGYSRIWPLRPEIEPMSRTVPMYASSTRSHFVSPIPYLTEAGRKIISRKVSSEQLRDRFQASWKNMVRISWIRCFNEMHAMRRLFYGDQAVVTYDQIPAHCYYDAGIGYKPQVREIAAHPSSSRPRVEQFDEIPYRFQAWQQPRRIRVGNIGTAGSNRGGQNIRPMLVSTLERGLCRSVAAGDDYESQVIYLDAYSPHMDTSAAALMESRGDVLVFLGGGTTSIHQVSDTHLHQN